MATNQFDSAIEIQLDALRAGASIKKDVLILLKKLERELIGKLAAEDVTTWNRKRLTQQLAETRALINQRFTEISSVAQDGTSAIAQVTARATAQSLAVSAVAMPTEAMLTSIVSNSLVQGAAQGDWWKRQSADTQFKFSQAVRMGMASAETNQQIIARVRSFFDTSRQGVAALVQTSVATIANDARMAVFESNGDIIKRYRAVGVLDTHTCLICAPLDGLEWEKDGAPIGHKFSQPHFPKHMNCRCLIIPVVFDGPQGGKRASDDGPISAELTFEKFLNRKSVQWQESVLGSGRVEIYRRKGLSLADLVSGNGRPITLAQLRKKYP